MGVASSWMSINTIINNGNSNKFLLSSITLDLNFYRPYVCGWVCDTQSKISESVSLLLRDISNVWRFYLPFTYFSYNTSWIRSHYFSHFLFSVSYAISLLVQHSYLFKKIYFSASRFVITYSSDGTQSTWLEWYINALCLFYARICLLQIYARAVYNTYIIVTVSLRNIYLYILM